MLRMNGTLVWGNPFGSVGLRLRVSRRGMQSPKMKDWLRVTPTKQMSSQSPQLSRFYTFCDRVPQFLVHFSYKPAWRRPAVNCRS